MFKKDRTFQENDLRMKTISKLSNRLIQNFVKCEVLPTFHEARALHGSDVIVPHISVLNFPLPVQHNTQKLR